MVKIIFYAGVLKFKQSKYMMAIQILAELSWDQVQAQAQKYKYTWSCYYQYVFKSGIKCCLLLKHFNVWFTTNWCYYKA